jgi:hypothetical protein
MIQLEDQERGVYGDRHHDLIGELETEGSLPVLASDQLTGQFEEIAPLALVEMSPGAKGRLDRRQPVLFEVGLGPTMPDQDRSATNLRAIASARVARSS